SVANVLMKRRAADTLRRLGAESLEQKSQLVGRDSDMRRAGVERHRQRKGAPVQTLVQKPGARRIEEQDLQPISRLVQKPENRSARRALAEVLGPHAREPVEAPAQVNGRLGDVDARVGREDHAISSAANRSRRRAGSKPWRTRTTRPEQSTTSRVAGSVG